MKSESEMELELNKGKSLYLCFNEFSRCGGKRFVNQVVRSIRMGSDDDDDEEEYLREAAYKRFEDGWNFSCRFGSQILFPFSARGCVGGVTHIRSLDTSARPLKYSSRTKLTFSRPKNRPVLGELNRKLYCIDTNPERIEGVDPQARPFEVLDPENDLKWRSLDAPPFIERDTCRFFASFLEGSNKILGWACKQPGGYMGKLPAGEQAWGPPEHPGVFCFDATKPENGWTESSFSLGNTLPSLGYQIRTPIFIQNHHPNLGAFHLLFNYDPIDDPLRVSAFFMSDNCDNFHRLTSTPLKLPDLCYEYNEFREPHSDTICTDFKFVHLGAQKVCLVLNKFFCDGHFQDRNTGKILLITFEYDIIATTVKDYCFKSTVQIQTRLLRTRRFRYHSRKLRKPDDTRTKSFCMTGAFLL
uniref:uncharacterized protein LOC101292446 n=1 Tax=Fragaria vesca subsp. vesca TaxID=101020 RepID=UPI0005C8C707|nr:PREDICTED: uncharacterized protein LOC101292446 [Fragaria vesca subsp. vesca]